MQSPLLLFRLKSPVPNKSNDRSVAKVSLTVYHLHNLTLRISPAHAGNCLWLARFSNNGGFERQVLPRPRHPARRLRARSVAAPHSIETALQFSPLAIC